MAPVVKNSMTVFYVKDQETAKLFYEYVLSAPPVLHVPGMTEFKLTEDSSLGLMPLAGIKKLLGSQHFTKDKTLSASSELYLRVTDCQDYLSRSIEAGATLVSQVQTRDWGDQVGYCITPDKHVLAFAEIR